MKNSTKPTGPSIEDPAYKKALELQYWKRHRLDFKLDLHQVRIEEAFNRCAPERIFVAKCSRQLGKTFWAAKKCVEVALRTKKGRIRYAASELKSVEEFAIPAFQAVLADVPKHLEPKWIEHKKKYKFRNGAEILLVGLDKHPNAGRGPYCDLYVLDEAAFITKLEYLTEDVIKPMFTRRPLGRIIMISSSPESPDHAFDEYYDMAKIKGASILLDIYQNVRLSPERIEQIRKDCKNETTWRREYLCETVVEASRAICPEWAEKTMVRKVERDEFFGFYQKYIFMDLGVVDLTAVIFGFYDFLNATFKAEDEIIMNGPDMTTEKLAGAISAKVESLWGAENEGIKAPVQWRGISDNDNPLLLQDLSSKYELHFTTAKKDKLEAMVNELRVWARNARIQVDPRCQYTAGALRAGIWNEKRTEFNRSKVYGHYDPVSAMMYGVRAIDVSHNPIPANHGRSIQTHWINPQTQGSESTESLKKAFKVNR